MILKRYGLEMSLLKKYEALRHIRRTSGGHALFIATRHAHTLHTWVVTHTHTHTHTHAGGTTVEGVLCFYPILASSPRDSQEQWAAELCSAWGPSPSARSWLGQGQDRRASALFACFYCWGSMGGTRVNTGRTCKLHTERPGNKPRHVARCGTWTHDLLAVRQQCYALCHRAPSTVCR